MGRFVALAGVALALVGFSNGGHAQSRTALAATPAAPRAIERFDDIAGKWDGFASPHNYTVGHNVSLEIDASGRFTARYAFGGESGEARLEGGALLIPLVEHRALLQLVRDGDTLKGPAQIGNRIWMVSLARAAAPVRGR